MRGPRTVLIVHILPRQEHTEGTENVSTTYIVSKNCLKATTSTKAAEIGIRDGRKWRQREEMGSKIGPTRAKNDGFVLSMVKNGSNRTYNGPKVAKNG